MSYERDPNPILALARRTMEPLLRDVRDKVVVDIGCGTGHDLEQVVSRGAKAVGIDFTAEMLHTAAQKKSIRTRLVRADARNLPLQEGSADFVVCSFVLSYVEDLESIAEQLARVALPGADVYLLDMHPEAHRHGWRSALDPSFKDVPAFIHELTNIRQVFDLAGLELESLVEPKLAHPERRLFEAVERIDLYEQARHLPALYLFHFRRRTLSTDRYRPHVIPRKRPRAWLLTGARVAMGPHTAVQADIAMDAARIRGIYDRPSKARTRHQAEDVQVDLSGILLLPGLINAHDHLHAGWPSRVTPDVAPWLGALRNLLSGVTTVVHDEGFDSSSAADFPVRVARNYARSCKQTAAEVAADLQDASPEMAILVDIGWCGTDTAPFIRDLDAAKLLTHRTILAGVAHLDRETQKLLLERKTAVIWSPAEGSVSQDFVLDNQLIALGTSGNGKTVLDEVRAAKEMGVPPETIYSMLTSRASSILRLRNGEGRIVGETPGDMLAIADTGVNPAQALCELDHSPVCVIVAGRPALVNDSLMGRVPESLRERLRPMAIGSQRWWAEEHLVAAVRGARRSRQQIRIAGEPILVQL